MATSSTSVHAGPIDKKTEVDGGGRRWMGMDGDGRRWTDGRARNGNGRGRAYSSLFLSGVW
eukprot:2225426-Pleurochrysis_carterae.AAC.1